MFLQKYQPQRLSEFESDADSGSSDADILRVLLRAESLNLLFVGDVGSGKTTYIQTIIREYYHEYNPSEYIDNILHINPLKDQGIHFYRSEMKTFAQTYSNIRGKKKIIVLDDLDMIQEQSQHVFRNYLDKYRHNVFFIAACTNQQKVIDALQSHLFIMRIILLPAPVIQRIADRIITTEQMSISNEAVQFLVEISNGSIKVMMHFLEAIYLYNCPVNLEQVMDICTNMHFRIFQQYINHLQATPPRLTDAVHQMYAIYDNGISVIDILDSFILFLKQTSLLSESLKYAIIPIVTKNIHVFHTIHEDEIELAIFTNHLVKLFHKK